MTDLHISRQITLRNLPSALCETRRALPFSQETATDLYYNPDESSLHSRSLLLGIGKHLPIYVYKFYAVSSGFTTKKYTFLIPLFVNHFIFQLHISLTNDSVIK
jgi:hypothetical protein